jgi:RND family efflux transporter MFP subunit
LTATKNYYTQVAALNSSANSTYATAVASGDINDVKAAYEVIDDYLTRSVTLLNMTFSVLTNTIVSTRFTQAQLDAFKSTISGDISASNAGLSALEQVKQSLDSAQTNYDTVISNSEQSLNSAQASLANAILGATNALTNAKLGRIRDLQAAQSQIDTATQNLKLTQAQLGKTTASARPEDIALASAQVRQAQANLDAVNNQINNSIIKAPFDGQITQVNYQVGEEPSATQPVMVILGQDQYEVQVDVAESDVAKVALGNPVELDFDAFGQGIRFTATLDQLDPAQTVIQEVVYYRGKVGHVTANTTSAPYLKQLKPGMTANVTIMANRKDSVLIIPFRAVTDNNGTRTVDILKNGQPVTVTVTLGLRGDDGLVEVLTGVSAGDEIILSHTP